MLRIVESCKLKPSSMTTPSKNEVEEWWVGTVEHITGRDSVESYPLIRCSNDSIHMIVKL